MVLLLLALPLLLVVFLVVFGLEVAALVRRQDASSLPSSRVRRAAALVYRAVEKTFYVMVAFFDWLGAVKRVVMWVRDVFFRWIPRETFEEAWHNVAAAMREFTRVPRAALVGTWRSIRESFSPALTVGIVLGVVVIGLPALQTGQQLAGVNAYWYPSSVIGRVGERLYALSVWLVQLLDVVHTLWNLLTWIFGKFPLEKLVTAFKDVYGAIWLTMKQPFLGLVDGAHSLFDWLPDMGAGLPDDGKRFLRDFMTLVSPILFLAIFLTVMSCCRPNLNQLVAGVGGGDDDDSSSSAAGGGSRRRKSVSSR